MSTIPEARAAERVGGLLSQYISAPLTQQFWQEVGGKVIANREALRAVFAEVDADPGSLRERGEVLRQQVTQQVDSAEWWSEHVHHLKREYEDAAAILERVKAGRMAEYDPDTRAADEDDVRVSTQRADESAAAGMPRVAS